MSGHGKSGLCLAEPFHQLDAGKPQPLLVDTRVERFAGNRAVAQGRQIVFRQVLAYEETEHRRGRTERGDAIVVNHAQHIDRLKLLEVVDKNIGPGYPLAIELSPHGFAPACVGQG